MIDTPTLSNFLMHTPPPVPVLRKRTFLDISGTSSSEQAISSCYAYFFDPGEEHGLGTLFLRSLIDLIAERTQKTVNISSVAVEKEVSTHTGKRIDILLRGTNEDAGNYIIIENKIYHWLHNDLLNYWDYCKGNDMCKVGVVLTLTREDVPEPAKGKFINILHGELIARVRKEMGGRPYPSAYLDDFLNAIENLSKDLIMDKDIVFYYENLEVCNRIYDIGDKAYAYIIGHFNSAAQLLGLKYGGNAKYYKYLYFTETDDLYYTLEFDKLFEKEMQLKINLEIGAEGIKLMAAIDEAVGEEMVLAHNLEYKPKNGGSRWLHYATMTYPQISIADMRRLGDFIAERIKQDFSVVQDNILKIIKESA